MGWDSFGLPAENAAIERGVSPSLWTERNVERMREQLGGMGGGFDWGRVGAMFFSVYWGMGQSGMLMMVVLLLE